MTKLVWAKSQSFRDAYKDMSSFSEKIPNEANDEVWIRTTASASPSRWSYHSATLPALRTPEHRKIEESMIGQIGPQGREFGPRRYWSLYWPFFCQRILAIILYLVRKKYRCEVADSNWWCLLYLHLCPGWVIFKKKREITCWLNYLVSNQTSQFDMKWNKSCYTSFNFEG